MLPERCTVWTCCSSNMRTAFTPLSTVLGSMIRELHRALLQALVVENYNLTLTQLIKVGAVAANTGARGVSGKKRRVCGCSHSGWGGVSGKER